MTGTNLKENDKGAGRAGDHGVCINISDWTYSGSVITDDRMISLSASASRIASGTLPGIPNWEPQRPEGKLARVSLVYYYAAG